MKPTTFEMCRALLTRHGVFVHLDAQKPGVVLPEYLQGRTQICLEFAYDLPIPIKDLKLDENGISGTLNFDGSSHFVSVPWTAVFGLADMYGRGMIWEENISAEIRATVEADKIAHERRSTFKAVEGGREKTPARANLRAV